MKRNMGVLPERRGCPPTGRDPVMTIRLSEELRSALNMAASERAGNHSRSELVRQIVMDWLARRGYLKAFYKPTDPGARAAKAAYAEQAAGKVIDQKLERTGHSDEVKAERKKRLTKIPVGLANRSRSGR